MIIVLYYKFSIICMGNNQKIKFKELSSKTLVKTVIDEIILKIRNGDLVPEQKLPSERQLISQLKVSRTSIREALKSLELLNVLEIKPGKGTYVRPLSFNSIMNPANLTFNLKKEDLLELSEIRKILEAEGVKLAIANINEKEIEYLKQKVNNMALFLKEKKFSEFTYEDFDFHKKIIECSKNKILICILNSILPLVRKSIDITWELVSRGEDILNEHKKIYQCIAKRDQEGAGKAILEHLSLANLILTYYFNEDE